MARARTSAVQAGAEADDHIDDRRRAAADRRQRGIAVESADDHRIHRVVQLLEQKSKQNGKEKAQQLFPNYALRQIVTGRH